ncbi:MAG: hypothetical protein HYV04_21660 [Deltaproteobacteria bacterium]|nr:hypothetical protein [Deltaproteobacteria bacterium]
MLVRVASVALLIAIVSFLLILIDPVAGEPLPQSVVSRQDADRIFGMTRHGWERVAEGSSYRGWKISLNPHNTGTEVMASDPTTGVALSVRPYYEDDQGLPQTLVIGSYYPVGFAAEATEQLQRDIQSAARKALGPAYSVSLVYTRSNRLDVIELFITRRTLN